MKRMDPSFSEKSLGFRSFSDFLRSRAEVPELTHPARLPPVRRMGQVMRHLLVPVAVWGATDRRRVAAFQ